MLATIKKIVVTIFGWTLFVCFTLYFVFFIGVVGSKSETTLVDDKQTGCGRYASKYNCNYVENKATYQVMYWKDVTENRPGDERYVGTAIGLSGCRDTAIYAHREEMEYRKKNWKDWSDYNDNWSERSYICLLTKNGNFEEKHRL
jgi:hypothetical protein